MEQVSYRLNAKPRLLRSDIVLPDLSYKVVGILFDVYNSFAFGHLERVYQRAVAQALTEAGISFAEQPQLSLIYKDGKIGRYIPDFVIEDSMVLELKQNIRLRRSHFDQANAYLRAANYSLAIIASFNKEGLIFRRLVNTY